MQVRGSRVFKKKDWKSVMFIPCIQWYFTESHLHNLCCYCLYSNLFSGGSSCLPLKHSLGAAVVGRVPCLRGVTTAKTLLPKRSGKCSGNTWIQPTAAMAGTQLYFQMFTANSYRKETKQSTTVLILNQLRSTWLGCAKKGFVFSPVSVTHFTTLSLNIPEQVVS